MVEEQLVSRGIRQPEVLEAMHIVPREAFVPADAAARAYEDGALGIGGGQTISQPYIVARMTEVLDLPGWRSRHPDLPMRVLDVGTGSGYQAAVLLAMGASVVGIERDETLAEEARQRLTALGMAAFEIHVADGSRGWSAGAPYAGIVVAAAAPDVPPPLVEQLADGARLVLPVGPLDHQELTLVTRDGPHLRTGALEPCVFVPLIGEYGFPTG
jgi:protein-L-isoaspartate(D-aspartate) O-methyltransferase